MTATVTHEYVASLPEIYQDILRQFTRYGSERNLLVGVPVPALAAALWKKYDFSQIRLACEKMVAARVLRREMEHVFYPTADGEQIIRILCEGQFPEQTVPDFPPVPVSSEG